MKRLPGIVVVAVLVVVAVAGINSWTGSGPGLGGTLAPGAPEVVRLSPTEALAALERLPEENLVMRAMSDESVRQTISMMLGGQVDLVLKKVLAG